MQIDDIVQMAKDRLLEDDNMYPTIYVEWDNDTMHIIVLDFLPDTTFEKEKVFFGMGLKAGEDEKVRVREVSQVCLVVESWVSHNRKYNFPSDDPERKEALAALLMTIQPTPAGRQTMHSLTTIEIIRDQQTNKVLDLLPQETMKEARSNLLLSFVAGFAFSKVSEAEREKLLRARER